MAKLTNTSSDDWEVPTLGPGVVVAAGESVDIPDELAGGFVDPDRWKVELPKAKPAARSKDEGE